MHASVCVIVVFVVITEWSDVCVVYSTATGDDVTEASEMTADPVTVTVRPVANSTLCLLS